MTDVDGSPTPWSVGAACRSCGVEIVAAERFCPSCGSKILDPEQERAREEARAAGARAQKWLNVIAVITLLSGLFMYQRGLNEVDKVWTQLDAQCQGMSAEQRDATLKDAVGMTYAEAKAHDYGAVRLLITVNLVITVVLVLFGWWARKDPFLASIVALLVLITIWVTNAAVDPKTIVQGVILKVVIVVVLTQSISSGWRARQAERAGQP